MSDEIQRHIELIARHLRGLGLTEQQIELHLAPLKTRHAAPNPSRRKIGRHSIIEFPLYSPLAQRRLFGLTQIFAPHPLALICLQLLGQMRGGTSRHLLLQLIANSGSASGLRSAVEPALKLFLATLRRL